MAAKTSEVKQLKEDRDKSEKEHEESFQNAIVSVETLYSSIEME